MQIYSMPHETAKAWFYVQKRREKKNLISVNVNYVYQPPFTHHIPSLHHLLALLLSLSLSLALSLFCYLWQTLFFFWHSEKIPKSLGKVFRFFFSYFVILLWKSARKRSSWRLDFTQCFSLLPLLCHWGWSLTLLISPLFLHAICIMYDEEMKRDEFYSILQLLEMTSIHFRIRRMKRMNWIMFTCWIMFSSNCCFLNYHPLFCSILIFNL